MNKALEAKFLLSDEEMFKWSDQTFTYSELISVINNYKNIIKSKFDLDYRVVFISTVSEDGCLEYSAFFQKKIGLFYFYDQKFHNGWIPFQWSFVAGILDIFYAERYSYDSEVEARIKSLERYQRELKSEKEAKERKRYLSKMKNLKKIM